MRRTRRMSQPRAQAKRRKASLPWMEVPVATAPADSVQLREACGMHPNLLEAMQRLGYSTLFPVQAAAWHVLAGGMSCAHDLCVSAPTGSGKTLAYALPVLQRCWQQPGGGSLRALVVVPTRALAQQARCLCSVFQHRLTMIMRVCCSQEALNLLMPPQASFGTKLSLQQAGTVARACFSCIT
jgi:superfamily II DNA/RNA helicase